MTQFLPPNLLALFAPREPIPYLPPASKLPHEKKNGGYIGVGTFLKYFEDPKDTPPPVRVETREERLERRRRERAEQVAYKLEQEIAVWDPAGIPNVTADPFKTLFVARINYDTSESKLRREFEVYGPVKKIVVIHNTINGKPRGYAFIEYEHERDMHSAYKHADGKKIDGRRVLVDVERARTVKGWLPRRLGGGLGGTRRGGPDVNIKHSGREDNERERERYRLERERETSGRGMDRDRDRDRLDRERRRSRDRKRRSRSRSRDRKRRRSRDRLPDPDIEEIQRDERPRDRRDRDRERDRDRDRKRSNDRDRDRDRDRKRNKRDRERERRDRKDRGDRQDEDTKEIRIKEEPLDDYPDYSNTFSTSGSYFTAVKYEDDNDQEVEEKYRIPEGRPDPPPYNNYDSVQDY
ncbi:U1 small nuclear ribonucleoprotein 70 kDa [Polistes fuscatus]|uniref:U1 small nuclear ribonucleoprotein 70 kDa n=1 Tax=Polistes fuscatus TaxID=30207 RepID=UPI001CA97096|nr:U1 small nuclear ribonucleoprotein 70 kDa [Polistes fuscatus]XP_043486677.1 U1 small nuclear ribonucleoprotein 70 kDa [Polistes fuscatus]